MDTVYAAAFLPLTHDGCPTDVQQPHRCPIGQLMPARHLAPFVGQLRRAARCLKPFARPLGQGALDEQVALPRISVMRAIGSVSFGPMRVQAAPGGEPHRR